MMMLMMMLVILMMVLIIFMMLVMLMIMMILMLMIEMETSDSDVITAPHGREQLFPSNSARHLLLRLLSSTKMFKDKVTGSRSFSEL